MRKNDDKMCLNFTTRLEFSYDLAMLFSDIEDVYKTLISDAEANYLPSNRASSIITLKAKVLSQKFLIETRSLCS